MPAIEQGETASLLIRGGRLIDPSQGIDYVGDALIRNGVVVWVGDRGQEAPVAEPYSSLVASGLVVCPGLVDIHCHLREPGFEDKETIATGSRAAARGGFTTICCMPNTNPPIDTRATVEYIQKTSRQCDLVRVLPIGCISKGQRGEELAEMGDLADAGVVAFSDDGRPVSNAELMRHAMEYSRSFGLPIDEHCEDLNLSSDGVMNEGWVSTRLGLKGIPVAAEEVMVARDIALAQLTGARLHIAHASTAGSVEIIRHAKEKGISVTAEATPHHLTLTEERVMGQGGPPRSIPEGRHRLIYSQYDTNTKVNPPLRTNKDIAALITGLREGVIDAIATDHAPHTSVDKLCEYDFAAFGISGFETALGSLLSLVHEGHLDLAALISKLTCEPAKIIESRNTPPGLGTLRIGAPGDVTIFDPDAEWVVDADKFASKGKNTPLNGCQLKGKVMATIFGGRVVHKDEGIRLIAIKSKE